MKTQARSGFLSARVPRPLIARLDAVVQKNPQMITRADLVRWALERSLPDVEADASVLLTGAKKRRAAS